MTDHAPVADLSGATDRQQASMSKPSLLILSLGELGTCMLEAAARCDLFDVIIVGSRSKQKAQERTGNAIIGAGTEGLFPKIIAEELDFSSPDFEAKLRDIAPDFLFSAPSYMPWWKVDELGVDLPFAAYTSLHLALMVQLRRRLASADCGAKWIGGSYPDVINAALNRTGYGPLCGIGNIQEPIAKIQLNVASVVGCSPREVKVKLVAQHAFEYYVLNAAKFDEIPPYLLKASVHGRDVSAIARDVLCDPFPFGYDLHFNRVTASAGIQAFRALTSDSPVDIHLPGVGSHLGGYPVNASHAGIEISLPHDWTMAQAIAINQESLTWDGIEDVTRDGTIVYSQHTQKALHRYLGRSPETLTIQNAQQQAKTLLDRIFS